MAELEAAEEALLDTLHTSKATLGHYELLVSIIPALLEAIDKAVYDEVRERMVDDQQYISYLKEENERLARLYKEAVDILEDNFNEEDQMEKT